MKFNSVNILTKTFTRKILGGYSSKEVANFLQDIAEELQQQDKITKKLSSALVEKEANIKEYKERESVLRDTITEAHKMANQFKEVAKKEAHFIVEDAQQKAHIIVQDARDSLKSAYQDLSDLQRLHIQLKNTLKSVLQSHHDLLDQEPMSTFLPSVFQNQNAPSPIENKLNQSLNNAIESKDTL